MNMADSAPGRRGKSLLTFPMLGMPRYLPSAVSHSSLTTLSLPKSDLACSLTGLLIEMCRFMNRCVHVFMTTRSEEVPMFLGEDSASWVGGIYAAVLPRDVSPDIQARLDVWS
jgi:hypothetical protein